MSVLCHDQRGHLGAMWRANCPTHMPAHGRLLNVKYRRKPVLNSQFSTFITRSSHCKALRALDFITMSIRPATHAHSASYSSFRPQVLGPAQPYLSLPTTFSSGGIYSQVLPSAPSLSCTSVLSRVMPRRHRMWCRRDGDCGLPS